MRKETFNADTKAINDLRVLTLDMIEKANSGHPGMAMDVAPALYVLYAHHLNAFPQDPKSPFRDRFVLSSGHCSALLYALLHMAGYEIAIDDLKSFRQLGSKTPGHPEYGLTPGIDATAGPLGQGIAQAVGMAMAEKHLAALYPQAKHLAHKTYVLCGDGCLEEGISQEAISYAGNLELNNLILIYDRNGSTLDDETSVSMKDDAALRFYSAGWNVLHVKDGNDIRAIDRALTKAKQSRSVPTAIIIDSTIGYGTPLQGSHKSHGSPLNAEDYEKTRKGFGADYEPFAVPEVSTNHLRALIKERTAALYEEKKAAYEEFMKTEEGKTYLKGVERVDYLSYLPDVPEQSHAEASRKVSGQIVAALGQKMPSFFGGSADVAASVMTAIPGDPLFSVVHPEGKDIRFGIREFGMASFINGILLHEGLTAYGGCFLVFSDYLKPAIRMAALEKLPAIYLFSHDSLAVGEDGPTHQPIEQLAMLRSIPGLVVLRPGDERETHFAWAEALKRKDGPTAIVLSRQKLLPIENSSPEGFARGAYVVYQPKAKIVPEGEVIASGSEVGLAIEAAKLLEEKGIYVNVVSMPSFELFEKQDENYKKSVLSLPYGKRVSLEMATTYGWGKYAAHNIGVDTYGASGKEKDVLKAYGFTSKEVAEKIQKALRG